MHPLRADAEAPTLLKLLGVPARDAQVMLGHEHVSTAQQIYTHVDETARLDAVSSLACKAAADNRRPAGLGNARHGLDQ
ncbi:MAG: hypothetical protein ACYCVZ_00005 [Streptosporangiaceae bacterium]